MPNILDYIKWRGDLTLKQSRFNEVDNLILSRFSYFPFDNIIKNDEIISIKELYDRFETFCKKEEADEFIDNTNINNGIVKLKKNDNNNSINNIDKDGKVENKSAIIKNKKRSKKNVDKIEEKIKSKIGILWPYDVDLFPLMGASERFGKMLATEYSNIFDKEREEQFAAITVILPGDIVYVSFRGTDDTVIGWKEDFNLSFQSHTASQISARKYLENIATRFPEKRIMVGGHSKGGNLAIYAAAFANQEVQNRIIKVYNNDGPGFCKDIIESDEYNRMLKFVHSYIPQSSVIGRLMNHEEKYSVVQSTQSGIMQHDLYSWQVLGNSFVLSDVLTDKSDFIDKTITGWVSSIEPERRKQFIDTIYEILLNADSDTINGIKKNWHDNSKIMLKSYKSLDKESKKMINDVLSSLLKNATSNALTKRGRKANKNQGILNVN